RVNYHLTSIAQLAGILRSEKSIVATFAWVFTDRGSSKMHGGAELFLAFLGEINYFLLSTSMYMEHMPIDRT
ncbi:hypothetical protein ACJX0J_031659, partial [Zea mays]